MNAHVFKVGGNELDDAGFVARFAALMADRRRSREAVVIVHGGGKELTLLLEALRVPTRFVDGLRVTDAQTRDAALMVLSGLANKRLVAALRARDADAIGVSGVDGGLIAVEPLREELLFVGKPVGVRAALLRAWIEQGLLPVIAPMSIGADGHIYNVNADHAASAVAAALDAHMLTFITNVPGVKDAAGSVIAQLGAAEAMRLIERGIIHGGMIPKVQAALDALASGVRCARITDLNGVASEGGTVVIA